RLEFLGYQRGGDLGIAGREAFAPPIGLPRHHLCICPLPSVALLEHLQFRDYLRTHPEDARAYEQLKRRAARVFPNDREAYTETKTSFVWSILRIATEGSND